MSKPTKKNYCSIDELIWILSAGEAGPSMEPYNSDNHLRKQLCCSRNYLPNLMPLKKKQTDLREAFLAFLFDKTPIDPKTIWINNPSDKKACLDKLCGGEIWTICIIENSRAEKFKKKAYKKLYDEGYWNNMKDVFQLVNHNIQCRITNPEPQDITVLAQHLDSMGIKHESLSFSRLLTALAIAALFHQEVLSHVYNNRIDLHVTRWLNTGDSYFGLPASVMVPSRPLPSGFFNRSPLIHPHLLPDLSCDGNIYSLKNKNTPLTQLLNANPDRHIIITGDPDSGTCVPGAGKTTTLYYHTKNDAPTAAFVPLKTVYTGHDSLFSWLISEGFHNDPKVYFLDGLDELPLEVIDVFNKDILELVERGKAQIVLTSRVPLYQLKYYSHLLTLHTFFEGAIHATVQPLTTTQKNSADSSEAVLDWLITPFLLSLYRDRSILSPEAQQRANRWPGMKDSPQNKEEVFYQSLISHICRWGDTFSSADTESAAVFSLFSLPMLAYCNYLHEIAPTSVRQQSEILSKTVLDSTLSLFGRGLMSHPGWRKPNHQKQLAAAKELLCYEKFEYSPACDLFPSSQFFDWSNGCFSIRHDFQNLAIRDEMAALHLAHLFFFSVHNALPEDEDILLLLSSPIQYVSKSMLISTYNYIRIYFTQSQIDSILRHDVPISGTPYSRFLLAHLCVELCDTSSESDPRVLAWLEEGVRAYTELKNYYPTLSKEHGREYFVRFLQRKTQWLRYERKYNEALFLAIQINHEYKYSTIPNLDFNIGLHSIGIVLRDQVEELLNQKNHRISSQYIQQVEFDLMQMALEIRFAINALVEGSFDPNQFPHLSFEAGPLNQVLFAYFKEMLDFANQRLMAYKEKLRTEFSSSGSVVRFLLEANFCYKALLISAALHPGVGGSSLQALGCLFQNDDEVFANSATLPFWKAHPELHVPVEKINYSDCNKAALQCFLRIYNIRRGDQPFAARQISSLLIEGVEHPLIPKKTDEEISFLEESTTRAVTSPRPGYGIPRLLFLKRQGKMDTLEYSRILQAEWVRCGSAAKINQERPDLYSLLLITCLSSSELLLSNVKKKSTDLDRLKNSFIEKSKIELSSPTKYTSGSRIRSTQLELLG